MASPTPGAEELGVELLPVERGNAELSDQDVLDAAVANALGEDAPDVVQDVPVPLGRTWLFDFEAGRFVRQGQTAVEVRGLDAVKQWCLMALHSGRFAHAVFSDNFGLEEPEAVYDAGPSTLAEVLSDFERHITEALLVHDRITAVENYDAEWDPTEGVLTIKTLDVVTDEEQQVIPLGGARLRPVVLT